MPVEHYLGVPFLLDQGGAVSHLDHAIDFQTLVSRDDDEEVRRRTNSLVLRQGKRKRIRTVVVAALTEELTGGARGHESAARPDFERDVRMSWPSCPHLLGIVAAGHGDLERRLDQS